MNEKLGADQRALVPDNAKNHAGGRNASPGNSCNVGVLTYIQRGADSALVKADKGSLFVEAFDTKDFIFLQIYMCIYILVYDIKLYLVFSKQN